MSLRSRHCGKLFRGTPATNNICGESNVAAVRQVLVPALQKTDALEAVLQRDFDVLARSNTKEIMGRFVGIEM
ncbi:hypothetical protein GCM10011496_33140 [Polaromonas eurypsychrophila]|uniref:Uncharacterized protein n=1 Tax=Polaromonas eurypsychrophila TaxID=1614635 RepID=A0A916SR77_9BURK|nr:hypothetical protein GCM10011496_33140 [Polaromonas eurypsychrophila]